MMHLTEDQIYHLVEAIGNHETLTAVARTGSNRKASA